VLVSTAQRPHLALVNAHCCVFASVIDTEHLVNDNLARYIRICDVAIMSP
jgi:hypothetical protein